MTDRTAHELAEARRLAKDWRVDEFTEIVDWSARLTDDQTHFEGLADLRRRLRRASRCSWLWGAVSVQYDGCVFPCCHTANVNAENRVYGNLLTDAFESVWNGDKYRASRASFGRRSSGPVGRNHPDSRLVG